MSDSKERALLDELERVLEIKVQDEALWLRALTHRSFLHDLKESNGQMHNEVLEFLGDAVLSLVAAEGAISRFPTIQEGALSQIRANYVCKENLARGAKAFGLGKMVRVAKAMRASGPVDIDSVLADLLESLIGAAYLDQGYEAARKLTLKLLGDIPKSPKESSKDSKTQLQELIQGLGAAVPKYEVMSEKGPAHAPVFQVRVALGAQSAVESGKNKKEAAQNAAKTLLGILGNLSNKERLEKLGLKSKKK